jgi:enamine deaminase RidA (YjgF/YER057c/UK114 family)
MTLEFLHPKNWKPAIGYSNGVAAQGRMVFTGGMIGWNADAEFETDDFAGQVAQALRNIVAVLAEAGAKPEHIVRLTWYVTDKAEYLNSLKDLGRAYKDIIGRHYPAMALVQVVALVEDRAKVEIEATAVIPT